MKLFRTWSFKWWEVGMIKVCLLSLGILVGIYCYPYVVGLVWLWWALFAITVAYFIPRVFRKDE